jgi:polyhydroxybutyrate depolymerase
MRLPARLLAILILCLIAASSAAQDLSRREAIRARRATQTTLTAALRPYEFDVEGTARTALIYAPHTAKETSTPVIFVFHGHGGGARQVAASFDMQRHWPEAVSVYMQGLNTVGRYDPSGRLPGWQREPGDYEDRDLKFFDAVLERLRREYRIDDARIYATGHSNGGVFTYLLWAERGDVFAAVAPSSTVAGRLAPRLKPKPALHVAGTSDSLVSFQWQKEMMDAVRRVNRCDETGKPWQTSGTLYPSSLGAPFVSFIHEGGHQFPPGTPELIARFLREHAKPAAKP